MLFDVHVVSQTDFSDWVDQDRAQRSGADADSYKTSSSSSRCPRTRRSIDWTDPELFQGIATQQIAPGPGPAAKHGRKSEPTMLGKLSWAAIPFDQPIPLVAGGVVLVAILAVLVWVVIKGHLPYLWRRMDHQRRPQADRRHVHAAGDGDAAARFQRCHHDADTAGDRVSVAGVSAAGALQPDLLRARHHHDLLCRDAVRDRVDEFRGAAAAWRPRRRFSDAELGRLLADRDRRAAGQCLARGRRIRAHRMVALSAAIGIDLFAGRRRRLLSVVAADFRGWHAGGRHQSGHDHAQGAHQRHDLFAHADVLLDHHWRQIC